MCPVYHPGRSRQRVGDRLKFVTYRVRCFLWLEKTSEGPFGGFGFAGDISESGAGLYLDAKIAKGTAVRIALEDETNTTYRGIVAWCQRYSLQQKFLGHGTLDHRLGVSLQFADELERQRYLMYFNDLRRRATALSGEFKF